MSIDRIHIISDIIVKQIAGLELTDAEHATFGEWLADKENEALYQELMDKRSRTKGKEAADELEQLLLDRTLEMINSHSDAQETPTATHRAVSPGIYRKLVVYSAAAILVVLAGATVFFLTREQSATRSGEGSQVTADLEGLKAGTSQAVLVLEDGTEMNLDSAQGRFSKAQSAAMILGSTGALTYQAGKGQPTAIATFNTLRVPKGGEYTLHLSDGSRVRLNAASSIRYPTSFSGMDSRTVELEGEAFFDIATDKARPFRVHTRSSALDKDVTVQVLGTHFNVSAYPDDPQVITTLVEGAVNIHFDRQTAALSPGQQGIVSASPQIKVQADADEVASAVAWTNGEFKFVNEQLPSILRRIGRWYNIDVRFGHDPGTFGYFGTVSRYTSLNDFLKILEDNEVRYKLEGRTLTIFP